MLTVFCLIQTALCVCFSGQPYFAFIFCYLFFGLEKVGSTLGPHKFISSTTPVNISQDSDILTAWWAGGGLSSISDYMPRLDIGLLLLLSAEARKVCGEWTKSGESPQRIHLVLRGSQCSRSEILLRRYSRPHQCEYIAAFSPLKCNW